MRQPCDLAAGFIVQHLVRTVHGLDHRICSDVLADFLLPAALRLFEIFISYPAIKAFLYVAVVLFQLDQRLTVTCVCSFEPAFFPDAYDEIVFRPHFFQQAVGPLYQYIVGLVFAVGI